MTAFLHNWLCALVGTAVICSLAIALTPEGKARKITALVCGLVMLVAILSPLKKFDVTAYGNALAKYSQQAEDVTKKADEINDKLSRSFIEQKSAAYILDKATLLNMDVTATVAARWDTEGYFYPYEASIKVNRGEDRQKLAGIIEADLGIPAEKQYWSSTDE